MSDLPFNVLMQQAAALKTAQLATERRRFDAHDEWYRNSLFARQSTRDVREADDESESEGYQKRMDYAMSCKQKGNELFGLGDFTNAIYEYEQSLGVFEYIHPLDPNWKKKGIEDRSLEERQYAAPTDAAAKEIAALKLTLLLNLSLSYLKSRNWSNCITAATRALQLDPQNTKALYRRAQARILPPSCGTVDNQLALQDLQTACRLRPEDAVLQSAYAELRVQLAEQRRKDKKQYDNLFARRDSGGDDDDAAAAAATAAADDATGGADGLQRPSLGQPLTWKDAFVALKDMESAAARYERDGDVVKAKEMHRKIASLQQQVDEHFPVASERERLAAAALAAVDGDAASASMRGSGAVGSAEGCQQRGSSGSGSGREFDDFIDFADPTPEMIADAQQRGLDITDGRVQRIMREISALRQRDIARSPEQQQQQQQQRSAQRRVEQYLQEATRNIYREEADHIAATLLSDLSEAEMRQMLVCRMQFQQQMAADATAAHLTQQQMVDMGLYEWCMQRVAAALGLKLPPRVQLPVGKDALEVMQQLKECIANDVVDLRIARDRAADALQRCSGDDDTPTSSSFSSRNSHNSSSNSNSSDRSGEGEALSDSVVSMLEQRYGVGATSKPGIVQVLLRAVGIGSKRRVQTLAFVMALLTCFLLVFLRLRGAAHGSAAQQQHHQQQDFEPELEREGAEFL